MRKRTFVLSALSFMMCCANIQAAENKGDAVCCCDKDEKKRKKLSKIIEELVQSGCEFKDDCSETSVILLMTKGGNQGTAGDLMLSIKEFAVYLYYEFLTEKIIATRN